MGDFSAKLNTIGHIDILSKIKVNHLLACEELDRFVESSAARPRDVRISD